MTLVQEGPRQTRIMLVGEAPGAEEARTGRPFVGGAGVLLDRVLERSGISRSECFVTNLCHVKPPENKFEWFYKKENQLHYLKGVIQLKKDVEEIKPNIIVALGGAPLRALTGRDAITKYRGSLLPATLTPGYKVMGTFHPAYALRVYEAKAIMELDFGKISREQLTPELILPIRDFFMPPATDNDRDANADWNTTRESLVCQMLQAEWLAVDIECWMVSANKWVVACVGFSDRASRALVIPWDTEPNKEAIRRLLISPVKKVYQNGMFDVTVLTDNGIEVNNFGWDTMLAHHSLFAESAGGEDEISALRGKKKMSVFQKGLAFQTSVYTREPYYKDDGKLWKDTNDIKMFWTYNAKDVSITREIRDVQARELVEFGTEGIFWQEMSMNEPLMYAMRRGILIDMARREGLREQYDTEIGRLQKFLNASAGSDINVKSPDVKHLLYDVLKLPMKKHKKTGRPTANKDAINELAGKHPHPVLLTILKIRERRDFQERYISAPVDRDNRMRCSFDITGTRSGRLSSRQSIYGSGTNLQNIPSRRREGEWIRSMFIADPGKVFVYPDFSQAEARVVAALARSEGLLALFNDPNRDVHKENASRIFSKPVDSITDEERYLAKKVVHASNYGMGGARLVELVAEEAETTGVRINKQQADRLIEAYFMIYPEIRNVFWNEVLSELRRSRTLNTPFGRKRSFYARWDDKLEREAYSYIPQSTVGDLCNRAVVRCYHDVQLAHPEWEAEFLLAVHDSILMQCKLGCELQVANAMQQAMHIPVPFDTPLIIPTDVKIGFNWGNRIEDKKTGGVENPLGLRKIEKWVASEVENAQG